MNSEKYQKNLKKAMEMLAKEGYIFIGQTTKYPGSPMYGSLKDIPTNQKIEFPVAENTQMGVSLGMSLEGVKVCSIFPRIDFLICGMDQLVNHIDKTEEMSQGEFKAGLIIRTQLGNTKPIYPGPQHCGDYTDGLSKFLKTTKIIKIKNENMIMQSYKEALKRAKKGQPTLLVEVPTGAFGGKR
jgi:pyruvate/2-oxoglutarate/acetoin dehydrogenase E1 component